MHLWRGASLMGKCYSLSNFLCKQEKKNICRKRGANQTSGRQGQVRLSKSPSSDFIWRGSSLVVGRFAAKRGSLRSPIGRLVASLGSGLCNWNVPLTIENVEFPKFQTGIVIEWKAPWGTLVYVTSVFDRVRRENRNETENREGGRGSGQKETFAFWKTPFSHKPSFLSARFGSVDC